MKQGEWPVLGAKVEVRVTKASNESTPTFKEKFELFDTGSGGKSHSMNFLFNHKVLYYYIDNVARGTVKKKKNDLNCIFVSIITKNY